MNKIILASILSVILLTTPIASVSAQSPEKSDKSKKSESKDIPDSQLKIFLPPKSSDDSNFILEMIEDPDFSGGYLQLVIDKRGMELMLGISTFDKDKGVLK
ncbi:MAG: hypothetical protein FJ359_06465 [Thaumarchaeota archaeon]|nr:hypothetical protein [Nitrososphaerota archaeon]